jgi:hypothetical protein
MRLSRSTAVLLVLLAACVIFGASAGSAYEAPHVSLTACCDTTPPTLQQPPNMTFSTPPAQLFRQVSFTVNATDPDNTSSEISIFCNWGGTAGVTFKAGETATVNLSVGVYTMSCYGVDLSGNTSATISFGVTVFFDTTPPVIQAGNQTVPATSPAGATVSYNISVTDPDDDSSSITVTCNPGSGGVLPVGTTPVACNAHDPAGNTAAQVLFTVTVTPFVPATTTTATTTTTTTTPSPPPTSTAPTPTTSTPTTTTSAPPLRDTTAPTIRPRSNITANAASPVGAVITYSVAATDPDNPATEIATSCSPASGSFFRLAPKAKTRTVTVTCGASDPAGNTAITSSFTVTVLGVHDQLVELQAEVTAAASVATSRRSLLALRLVHADLDHSSRSVKAAASQLSSFIKDVRSSPRVTRAERALWIRAATRISAVIG